MGPHKLYLFLICLVFGSCGKSPLFTPLDSGNEATRYLAPINSNEGLTWGKSDYRFGIRWLKKPAIGENSPFEIKFWNHKTGNFLGPYTALKEELCVFLWMVMPDGSEHGSSPIIVEKINSESETYYLADDVYFIMPGNWQLKIRTVNEAGHCRGMKDDPFIEERTLEVHAR